MATPGTTGSSTANIDAFIRPDDLLWLNPPTPTLATVLAEVRELRALVQALVDAQPPRSDVLVMPGSEEPIHQMVARYMRAAP